MYNVHRFSMKNAERVFKTLDTSGDGLLDHNEMCTAARKLGIHSKLLFFI